MLLKLYLEHIYYTLKHYKLLYQHLSFNEPPYRNLRVRIVTQFANFDQGAAMNGSPKAQFPM